MLQEVFCPDALGDIHMRHLYGPASVALCKLVHRGTLPLLVCLMWALCQAVSQSWSYFCPRVPGSVT